MHTKTRGPATGLQMLTHVQGYLRFSLETKRLQTLNFRIEKEVKCEVIRRDCDCTVGETSRSDSKVVKKIH